MYSVFIFLINIEVLCLEFYRIFFICQEIAQPKPNQSKAKGLVSPIKPILSLDSLDSLSLSS